MGQPNYDDITADTLLTIGDEHFLEIVNQNIRGETSDAVNLALTGNLSVLCRWANSLNVIKRNTETQFSKLKDEMAIKQYECYQKGVPGRVEWLRFKAEKARWRTGAMRFNAGVEQKLGKVRWLIQNFVFEEVDGGS